MIRAQAFRRRRAGLALVGLAASLTCATFLLCAASASAAGTPREPEQPNQPLVGQCFNNTRLEVIELLSPPRPAVDCARRHTSEVYRVGVWPGKKSPYVLPAERVRYQATRVCLPWVVTGTPYFTYWAYWLPTQEQWAAGERWVRCDALVASSTTPLQFLRWTGAKLNVS